MFLVLPAKFTDFNMYDQRYLEYTIRQQQNNIKVIRRTIQEVTRTAKLSENNSLIV